MYTNSVFENKWWLDVASQENCVEVFIEEENEVIARWCVAMKGRYVYMPPQTQTMGFWISPKILFNDVYGNRRKEITNQLLDKVNCKKGVIALGLQNTYFLPFIWKGFTASPRVTYRLNDLSDLDVIYSRFAKIVKKNIKSAINKVEIRESDDVKPLYGLMEKTFGMQKRKYPYSYTFIESIYTACRFHNAGKIFYAYDQAGNLHSGTMFVYDENTCYYLLAGTDPQHRSSGANSLLVWEGIRFASKMSKCFDFEGSMIEGIENFVRQFGGEPIVYYEVKRLSVLQSLREILKPKVKRFLGYK